MKQSINADRVLVFCIFSIKYLFIIQPGGVKAMWPSLPLNQPSNELHIHSQSIQKKKNNNIIHVIKWKS